MTAKKISILYLYPYEMNTYGDWGNVCVLQKRLEWRGYQVEVIKHHPGSRLARRPDIIFFGGGQDSGQSLILGDLHKQAPRLREWIEDGVATLAICGGYQLLGREFITATGEHLEGVGVFDIATQAQPDRLIGNVVAVNDEFGTIVGFENHSGRTFLYGDIQPLGRVKKGGGNNGEDGGEGVIYKSAVGTYLHGPLLPKNPQIADWLIANALGISNKELAQLSDDFIVQARSIAAHKL